MHRSANPRHTWSIWISSLAPAVSGQGCCRTSDSGWRPVTIARPSGSRGTPIRYGVMQARWECWRRCGGRLYARVHGLPAGAPGDVGWSAGCGTRRGHHRQPLCMTIPPIDAVHKPFVKLRNRLRSTRGNQAGPCREGFPVTAETASDTAPPRLRRTVLDLLPVDGESSRVDGQTIEDDNSTSVMIVLIVAGPVFCQPV